MHIGSKTGSSLSQENSPHKNMNYVRNQKYAFDELFFSWSEDCIIANQCFNARNKNRRVVIKNEYANYEEKLSTKENDQRTLIFEFNLVEKKYFTISTDPVVTGIRLFFNEQSSNPNTT